MVTHSNMRFQRDLKPKTKSFFLFGPRGVGKSTWLKQILSEAFKIDLLEARKYLALSADPSELGAWVSHLHPRQWVVLDEVQKVPSLLDEVHRLMEEKQLRFAMSGSSARKLKRGGANLLAGRALEIHLFPLNSHELGSHFSLKSVLQWGTLPHVYLDMENARDTLDVYVNAYLKEEVKEEGIIRRFEPFIRFLQVMGILNGQVLNVEGVARDAKVGRTTVDNYISVLEETWLGLRLNPYQPQAKVREAVHPKFYWFDPGVARAAAGLAVGDVDGQWLGFSLETFLLNEIRSYLAYSEKRHPVYYYRTNSGSEIDFVIESKKGLQSRKPEVITVEVKLNQHWNRKWEEPMRSLKETGKVDVRKMIGVYTGKSVLTFGELQVLPVEVFLRKLHAGEVV